VVCDPLDHALQACAAHLQKLNVELSDLFFLGGRWDNHTGELGGELCHEPVKVAEAAQAHDHAVVLDDGHV